MKFFVKILVILVVLAAGGHYLWAKTSYLDFIKPRLERLCCITDETKDWKTYTNKEYGFEFKYPSNLKIVSEEPSNYDLIQVYFGDGNNKLGYNVGYSTSESIKEYENCNLSDASIPGCPTVEPLACESKDINSCSNYYHAVMGGFWGKWGVVKSKDRRIELLTYLSDNFGGDKLYGKELIADNSLNNWLKNGEITQQDYDQATIFNLILKTIKFTK